MQRIVRALWLLLALAWAGSVSAASWDGLYVRVSAPTPVLLGDVNVFVNVSVTNGTQAAISVPRWELPSARHDSKLFTVTLDGSPVPYKGRLIKRAAPAVSDWVTIAAGATLEYSVELTAGYDLSRNGRYSVEFNSPGSSGGRGVMKSAPAFVWLESRSGVGAARTAPASTNLTDGAPTFTACSASQITDLNNAVSSANTYSQGVLTYMQNSRVATQRFTEWFGPGTRSSWNAVKTNFVKVQDAFATKPLRFDCTCTDNYYAYVYPDDHYKIYLCKAFWAAPALGTDSKAGTLIHEMSHFTVVADTDDWAYGQTAARALALSNPSRAIRNADSHEYIAENTPAKP
ncbi:M35 family metallo-endopeptidase [Roseateles albus]|uniref:M35 family metallo-endopeptidase n=1 Tax=Roseateles albus TaxID=2987525 RepID=A0ABT5KEF6_9BURK|nr:M35 family metallo-endopeptidase [Roseateles albus]MDC8772312.1 M35 family metallo-endopeptidase [Roseateles albus]